AYNLGYSNETYHGPLSVIGYLFTVPMERARADMLWYTGGIGAALLLPRVRTSRWTIVIYAWLVSAILSIAINGSRDLPNYFVQAAPPLALAAGAGFAQLPRYRRSLRAAVLALLIVGLWRVGTDTPVFGMRLASMPGLVDNVRFDTKYLMGHIDRDTYLARFSGKKHNALENARLVDYVDVTTRPDESIFVFGFSGGSVCWLSRRESASRFFWSMPVIREFAASTPGYGSRGLLQDLERARPQVVALQKEEWRSRDFFMSNPALRAWLEAHYAPVRETEMFSVWRRMP
ncbi:MAG TPA: hypothetical protein VNR64_17260, partial [Vicinamibacterales bacterium]|nr:hypothetical protein [Vicinamibacterales bacterium]